MVASSRAGRYVKQPNNYSAFIPAPLPPRPAIELDAELVRLLSEADRAVGRLDGAASVLPNPDLFVAMYVRQEAVLSSQIEGTQSTLEDVIEFEAGAQGKGHPRDVHEVVNYVRAMQYGLERVKELPLSLRLIREIHGELLKGVRGGERTPGEFRRSQNWLGPPGCTLAEATFVPPPVPEMNEALANFEDFLREREAFPVLIHCAVTHAQFETIHPFLDGNGRVGRLLIAFLLCDRQVLGRPLLYLSLYLKEHRGEYYDRLTAVRTEGDWEGWVKFFLRGVAEAGRQATVTARAILDLREEHRERLSRDVKALRVLDGLFESPLTTAKLVRERLRCTAPTANSLLRRLEKAGILKETTGRERYRCWRYEPYLALFERPAASAGHSAPKEDSR